MTLKASFGNWSLAEPEVMPAQSATKQKPHDEHREDPRARREEYCLLIQVSVLSQSCLYKMLLTRRKNYRTSWLDNVPGLSAYSCHTS